MHTSPGEEQVGEFLSWTVFDAHSVRLLAHLARPLADTFGVVAPFRKAVFDNSVLESSQALDRLAEAFWADGPREESDVVELRRLFGEAPPQLSQAIQSVAPDFFGWLRW